LTIGSPQRDHLQTVEDYEVIAQELSDLGEKIRSLEERLTEVERVNTRLEEAALTTSRALGEVSHHWDAVYDAMRRVETIDPQTSSERDHAASSARRKAEQCPAGPDH
jgi:predicted nuclease with TOPRIM domain